MRRAALAALALVAVGCGRKEAGPAPAAGGAAPAEPAPYEVRTPAVSVAAGQEARAALDIVPKAPWHINEDYPTAVTVTAGPGVKVARTTFENAPGQPPTITTSAESLHLDVPVQGGQAGTETVRAHVKFAVCTADTCVPHQEDVSWQVTVTP